MKKLAECHAGQLPQEPSVSSSQDEISAESMRLQLKMLNKGIVVHVIDVQDTNESSDLVVVKLQILTEVGHMSTFGNVKLRLAKQAAGKL